MPVQSSNSNVSAHPNLATKLLQILIPTTVNGLLCQKGQSTLELYPRRWFIRKIFSYYPQKVKIENSLKKMLSVQKKGFQETACSKDRREGPG